MRADFVSSKTYSARNVCTPRAECTRSTRGQKNKNTDRKFEAHGRQAQPAAQAVRPKPCLVFSGIIVLGGRGLPTIMQGLGVVHTGQGVRW